MTIHQTGATGSTDDATGLSSSRLLHSVLAAMMASVALLIPAAPPAYAAEGGASMQPIDIIIGDSSATNFAQGVTAEQRWTRLFADADGARELNMAVGGTGFVVGGANTFDKQLDRVLTQLKSEHVGHDRVRRIFVVGGGNDVARAPDIARLVASSGALADRVKAEFPKAQRLYIPDASPATGLMLAAYNRVKPFMPYMFLNMHTRGFLYEKNWYAWLPNAESHGYAVADNTHLSVAGHNEMAHMVAGWVNSLNGPKVNGTIAEYSADPVGKTPAGKDSANVVIRFQANGGTGILDRLEIGDTSAGNNETVNPEGSGSGNTGHAGGSADGDEVTLPTRGFTQSKRRIIAWNTAADGSGTSYRPGSHIASPSHSLMLYAQWGVDKTAESHAEAAEAKTLMPLRVAAIAGAGVLLATVAVLAAVHRRRRK